VAVIEQVLDMSEVERKCENCKKFKPIKEQPWGVFGHCQDKSDYATRIFDLLGAGSRSVEYCWLEENPNKWHPPKVNRFFEPK
jgi:hypothetical protein